MSKRPPIPPAQRVHAGSSGESSGRRDRKTGLQSHEPGDRDANLREQGRFGNIAQNVNATHWKTQDR